MVFWGHADILRLQYYPSNSLVSPAQGDGEPCHVVVDPDEADEGLG